MSLSTSNMPMVTNLHESRLSYELDARTPPCNLAPVIQVDSYPTNNEPQLKEFGSSPLATSTPVVTRQAYEPRVNPSSSASGSLTQTLSLNGSSCFHPNPAGPNAPEAVAASPDDHDEKPIYCIHPEKINRYDQRTEM